MLSQMQDTAKDIYGFEIIYGDTDSLFLNNTNERGLKDFQQKFLTENDIDLEIKNKYTKLFLSGGKKHYLGIEEGCQDPDIVGFEGIKSDRPEFYHHVYKQLAKDVVEDGKDALLNVLQAFATIGSVSDPELLKVSQVLSRDPPDYVGNGQIVQIGKAIGAKKGDAVWHYHANKKKTGKSWTRDSSEIDIQHYKQLLWNTVDEILEIAGYPLADLIKEFGVKFDKPKSNKKKKKDNKKKRVLEGYSIVSNNLGNAGGIENV